MWRCPRSCRKHWVAISPALVFCAAACGGKTIEQPDPIDIVKADGGASSTFGGGRASGGVTGLSRGGASGGVPIASGGRVSGGSAGGQVAGSAARGGFAGSFADGGFASAGFAGGGFAGSFAGGGVAGFASAGFAGGGFAGSLSCVGPDGTIPFESRGCLIDSDCAALELPNCCTRDRVVGVAKYLACVAPPINCAAVDCLEVLGLQTDDGQVTSDSSEIVVRCQFGEPGAGLCRTTLKGSDTTGSIPCGAVTCDAGEMCIHLSQRGGPPPFCMPLPANANCPPGTVYEPNCSGGSEPGCQEVLVTPEPFCAPVPPGCGSPTACACLPPDVCQRPPQVCNDVMGRQVHCLDNTP